MARRYLLFVVAAFINAFGIAAITRASLGTSPITSLTYVLSMFTELTMGQWTMIVNIAFVLIELPMMRKEEIRKDIRMYLLQIPISLGFGYFIDVSMNALDWLHPEEYYMKILALLTGCVILGIGISLEVKANVAMMSGEYLVRVISRRFRKDFGYVKLGLDVTLLVMACLLSLAFMSGLYGVREGTLVAALLVGPIVHFITPYLKFMDKWIFPGQAGSSADGQFVNGNVEPDPAGGHVVVTIAREYGSGGHILGEMLSDKLNVKLFDKEIIEMAAREGGYTEEYVSENEQYISPNYLLDVIFSDFAAPAEKELCKSDALFLAESRAIRKIAAEQSCVIVGRCSDFILKDMPGVSVVRIFCCSAREDAVRRCLEDYHGRGGKVAQDSFTDSDAASETERVNRARAAHYQHYTGKTWGDPHNYDLVINTSEIRLEDACNIVFGYVQDVRCKEILQTV